VAEGALAVAQRLYWVATDLQGEGMNRNADESGRGRAPRPLAGYIDPAWRLRSRGDAGIRRTLEGLLGPFLEQRRIDVTATGNSLVIACRDRSCATELRFLQREIRKTLNASGYPAIEEVRVVLAAPAPPPSEAVVPATRRAIPATARQALENAADRIADQRLAGALLRLARAGLGEN
jgi:hypothetical protein